MRLRWTKNSAARTTSNQDDDLTAESQEQCDIPEQPRLRLAFATVTAAGAGNFLFHFYRDSGEILRLGYWNALVAYRVYGCYALALGVSIAVSQLRLQARGRRRPEGARRVLAIAVVVFYYCLLGVLDVRTSHGIGTYASLYLSLVVP